MIEARNDPVADLGRFGDDPNQLDGLTDLSSGAGRAPDQMQAEVRNRLSTEISRLTWVNDDNESRGGCGFEFPEVREGQSRSLARWSVRGNIPDERWDQAVAIVQAITETYGFRHPRSDRQPAR